MKFPVGLLSIVFLSLALVISGCHRESRVDASRALEHAFQAADPSVTQAVLAATASLRAGEYTEMARAMNPVLAGRPLTPEQKEAAGQLFRQINQALSSNPNIDSKELYELRNRLHQGVTGGSRF